MVYDTIQKKKKKKTKKEKKSGVVYDSQGLMQAWPRKEKGMLDKMTKDLSAVVEEDCCCITEYRGSNW